MIDYVIQYKNHCLETVTETEGDKEIALARARALSLISEVKVYESTGNRGQVHKQVLIYDSSEE
jgi:hypothetical protein